MKCDLCRKPGELHQVEAPVIRVCTACRERFRTHIGIVCDSCSVCWWLPKTPDNVMQAAEYLGGTPQQVMDNATLYLVKTCKRCYKAMKDFMVEGRVQLH